MRIYVLTQEDSFYLPLLFQRFFDRLPPDGCELRGAALLEGEVAVGNIGRYLRFLGPIPFLRHGLHYAKHRLLDMVDRWVEMPRPHSVRGAFRRREIPTCAPSSLKDPAFMELLERENLDLIISIACPEVIPSNVLDLPKWGCINVHGALLPRYRGLLPSFWVLAEGESETGVTVHVMNEELDDGPIIVQERIPIDEEDTMHSLVLKSKVETGPELLAEAVRRIRDGTVDLKENPASEATYYSFPTAQAAEEFRRRGRRFR